MRVRLRFDATETFASGVAGMMGWRSTTLSRSGRWWISTVNVAQTNVAGSRACTIWMGLRLFAMTAM